MKTLHALLSLNAALLSLPSWAGPTEEALQVVGQWAQAFSASDVDGIVKLYAPDALFIGTGSKTIVNQAAGVRAYFEQALSANRPHSASIDSYSVAQLSDSAVVVTGLDTLTATREGQTLTGKGRVTFLLVKHEVGWKIIHFHRSALPG